MEFKNNFEAENKPDFLVINNGEDCIKFNLLQAEHDLRNCDIPEKIIEEMIRRVEKFRKEVEKGNKEGIHYGSNNLSEAINSLFYTEEDLGFNTEIERKLAAMVFKKNCEQDDELEIGKIKTTTPKDDRLEIYDVKHKAN